MYMRRSGIICTCLAALLSSGCTSVPAIEKQDYVHVADVLYSVECELKESIDYLARYYPFAKNQLVQVIYQLRVVESGGGDADAMIVVPIHNGTFSVGFAANLATEATRDTSLTVQYETGKLSCPDHHGEPGRPVRIQGGVGLANWLVRTSQALAQAEETPVGMSYYTGFDVVVGASVAPRFGIQKASGHQYGGGLQVAGRRQRFHSVTVSTTDIKDDTPEVAQQRLNQQVQQFFLQDLRRN
jgi:hypothetical protein